MMTIKLSIIVPVYNEINLLSKFIEQLFETFDQKTTKFIFIDDGSNDGSKEFLKENISKFVNSAHFELILLNKKMKRHKPLINNKLQKYIIKMRKYEGIKEL